MALEATNGAGDNGMALDSAAQTPDNDPESKEKAEDPWTQVLALGGTKRGRGVANKGRLRALYHS